MRCRTEHGAPCINGYQNKARQGLQGKRSDDESRKAMMAESSVASAAVAEFFGHARGLATLFLTEYWERFKICLPPVPA